MSVGNPGIPKTGVGQAVVLYTTFQEAFLARGHLPRAIQREHVPTMLVHAKRVPSIGRQIAGLDRAIVEVDGSSKTLHARKQPVVTFVVGFDVAKKARQGRLEGGRITNCA